MEHRVRGLLRFLIFFYPSATLNTGACVESNICSLDLKILQGQTHSYYPNPNISLRLGFRRNFLSVLHPNLVSSPIEGILEILLWPPGAFRWIFWHGRIVSNQVQVRFHKLTYFLVQICKKYWYFLTLYSVYPTK